MKKNEVKAILIALIIVICLNIGAYAAYVLSATDVTYTKSDGTTVSVSAALDELRAQLPKSMGTEVGFAGERFYVLDWGDTQATLMCKYCIDVKTYKQTNVTASQYVISNTRAGSMSSGYQQDDNLVNCFSYSMRYQKKAVRESANYAKSIGADWGGCLNDFGFEVIMEKYYNDEGYWNNAKIQEMILGSAGVDGFLKYYESTAERDKSFYIDGSYIEDGDVNCGENEAKAGVRPVIKVPLSSVTD